ncbi:neutral zinc metallopeptidase [Candidatus Mycolicibacterium alkanivorans]|uniref:Neutral zinc metallopeptidase n=1 Tax=Candidatus Mycolicibacterium alkanivorans TaxID=2954114 RepID=A0ABS9YW00_9MYCO|nr:neutral zinc metallopeptidase [Candidatus Mycolicibacterium alkanivorans]MCI4675067.1 neutral zinc metallopeptidase [Candidatus Mycolicibacterium alkanivorans]
MRPRHLRRLLAVAGAAVVLAGCGTTVQGKPVSIFEDPFKVAGLQAVDGDSGLRSNAEKPTREVTDGDGGKDDEIAAQSVSDLETFWQEAYSQTFDGKFQPVKDLISWDPNGYAGTFCDESTDGLINAAFCEDDNTIGWDRGVLLPSLRQANGDMAITMVLAHEYGHAIQKLAKLNKKGTPTLVAEQQADCFAGVYMRWVAEGNSPRFTLSTGDGLNNLLAAMISFRDPLLSQNDYYSTGDEHGSAFERISAFQFGFTDGASSCAAIDAAEIGQRRGDLPVELQSDQTGEWPVSEESTRAIVDAMNILFSPKNPPHLMFDAASASTCPDARPSPPVSFCPATNTIAVDLPGLEKIGAPNEGQDNVLVQGDNTAYSVVVSRYMLALQHQQSGLVLDNATAGLRTACLTGVATTKLSEEVTTPDGNTVALTAGDIDEAVSGLLTNGLAASDINGETVPAGFSRIDAFRIGVLGDQERCLKRFP